MVARFGRLRAEQSGFTMVELMVTLLVMSVVVAGALGFLHSLMRNDRYQEALVNNQETVRFAMLDITRDFRNANPLLPLSSLAEYDAKADIALGPESGPQEYVRWELTARTLYRHELDSARNVVASRVVLEGVDNADVGVDLFEFYDEDGNRITELPTAFPADVANCAIRVHVTVYAADDPVGSVFTETGDAEIRNRLPGGIGCTYGP